jgi:hypothetical protein
MLVTAIPQEAGAAGKSKFESQDSDFDIKVSDFVFTFIVKNKTPTRSAGVSHL